MGGTQPKRRSQHVQGNKALKATGGNFAFEFPAQKISVEAERPDGAIDVANVSVVAVVPYIIMKSIESNFVDLQASVISCNILSSGAEPLAKFPKPVRVRVEKCVCAAYKESRHINWDL